MMHMSGATANEMFRDEELAELEGLFRHIYRRDTKANRLNVQRGFKRLRQLKPIGSE